MTRKNLWCVGVLLLTFLSNVLAEQPADIDSAFGYRLGATFDPTGAREINLELNKMMGTREYEIQPSKEYGLFKTYSVTVSPKSNRIWLISAEAKFNEPTICTREMKDLHLVLVGKYGPSLSINHPSVQKKLIFRYGGFFEGLTYFRPIGSRSITANCLGVEETYTLSIKYSATEVLQEDGLVDKLQERTRYDPSVL